MGEQWAAGASFREGMRRVDACNRAQDAAFNAQRERASHLHFVEERRRREGENYVSESPADRRLNYRIRESERKQKEQERQIESFARLQAEEANQQRLMTQFFASQEKEKRKRRLPRIKPKPIKFYNPISNETLKHRERDDGIDLFVWKGKVSSKMENKTDHQHSILEPLGRQPLFIRDFNRKIVADSELEDEDCFFCGKVPRKCHCI
jgi:hypothetical protein